MDRALRGAQLLEELDVLTKSGHCSPAPGSKKNMLCHWKWKLHRFLEDMRGRRSLCVVCLQVHRVDGLPPEMSGQVLVVGWKTNGCKGEHTLPVRVCDGTAAFEEIFLHYCVDGGGGAEDVLSSFVVWVSLVDAADCDLGTFHVDLRELRSLESLRSSKFGGKAMSFLLKGRASGGALELSVFCRVTDEEDPSITGGKKPSKCFSCLLPNIGCLRSRPVTYSARRIPSLRSDHGFITIENSAALEHCAQSNFEGDGGSGFITIEKGSSWASSRRTPSELLANADKSGGPEDEKRCLVTELGGGQELDGDKVEDDFLSMLEEKYWKARDGASWRKETPEGRSLRLSMDLDLDLDGMIKEAETELRRRQQQVQKQSGIGGASLEREEFEELARRWRRSNVGRINSSSGSSVVHGFGSPL